MLLWLLLGIIIVRLLFLLAVIWFFVLSFSRFGRRALMVGIAGLGGVVVGTDEWRVTRLVVQSEVSCLLGEIDDDSQCTETIIAIQGF
jgi:succinate-acetate transporter protein